MICHCGDCALKTGTDIDSDVRLRGDHDQSVHIATTALLFCCSPDLLI